MLLLQCMYQILQLDFLHVMLVLCELNRSWRCSTNWTRSSVIVFRLLVIPLAAGVMHNWFNVRLSCVHGPTVRSVVCQTPVFELFTLSDFLLPRWQSFEQSLWNSSIVCVCLSKILTVCCYAFVRDVARYWPISEILTLTDLGPVSPTWVNCNHSLSPHITSVQRQICFTNTRWGLTQVSFNRGTLAG